MNKYIFISIVLVAALIAAAGCTGTGTTGQGTTPAGTQGQGTQPQQTGVVLTLTTGPVDTMPENIAVTVDVGQKDYMGVIPVTFQGGYGQSATKIVKTTLTRTDGTSETKNIGTNKGDMVELQGTRGTGNLEGQVDRVEVWVTMNNGKTYKIMDVLREYRSRA